VGINRPIIHGNEHQPRGADPTRTERWHKCGDDGEPALVNSWAGRLWFKLVVGAPNHPNQSLEVMLAVDGGAAGSVITTLPLNCVAWADGEKIPGNGHDSAGAFRAFHIDGATGDIIDGSIP